MQFLQIRSADLLTNPAGSVTNLTRWVFRNALDRPGGAGTKARTPAVICFRIVKIITFKRS